MKHHVERTSPKGPGQKFIGTCRLCGAADLTMAAALEDCENARGLTVEQALIETIAPSDTQSWEGWNKPMWQRGPGEGYMAAKDAALAINPNLKCRAVYYKGKRAGYVVEDETGKSMGTGTISRDAWSNAYFKAGGTFPIPSPQ